MHCTDCGYISFKKEKACRSCGLKFKKSTQSSQSFAGKETFSISTGSTKGQSEDSSVVESVGLLDEQEPASFIDSETGDFNLDLPDTSEETTNELPVPSENKGYQSMEFNMYEDIELEEIEGLGLEPLNVAETLGEPETDTTVDSIEEIKIDEPEETSSLEPVLEIGESGIEEVTLGLDDNEIVLGLYDSESTPEAPPVAAETLDEIELNLEIDDSDNPLTIQNQDIPDIKIEDLGLELEQPDDPEPDKS